MMPTSTATIQPRTPAALMEDQLNAALAELNRQIEMALVVELAKLAPGDRRLFRAELAPINSRMDTSVAASKAGHGSLSTLVVDCDPPKMWLVERGSDADNLTDEQATMLIKAGAAMCRWMGDEPTDDCGVALCDFHHPEGWL